MPPQMKEKTHRPWKYHIIPVYTIFSNIEGLREYVALNEKALRRGQIDVKRNTNHQQSITLRNLIHETGQHQPQNFSIKCTHPMQKSFLQRCLRVVTFTIWNEVCHHVLLYQHHFDTSSYSMITRHHARSRCFRFLTKSMEPVSRALASTTMTARRMT